MPLLVKDMKKNGVAQANNSMDTVATVCADLFVSILEDCAKEKNTTKKRVASFFQNSTTPQNNAPHEAMAKIFKETADYYTYQRFHE